MSYTRELWNPGDKALFEYHCYEGHDSSDAELWYRSHSSVTVCGLDPQADNEPGDGYAWRMEQGLPLVYLIRFEDGEQFSAWEDELLTDARGYERQAPPKRGSITFQER